MAIKDQEEGASLLSIGLATGTAAVGLKYGFKTMFPPTAAISASGPIAAAVKSVTSISDPTDASHFINYLNNSLSYVSDTTKRASILKTALQQALNSTDPVLAKSLKKAAETLVNTEDAGVQQAVEAIIRNKASRTNIGIFNQFQRNVKALTKHYQVTGGLATFSNVIPGKPTMIPMEVPAGIQSRVSNIAQLLGAHTTVRGNFFSTPGLAKEGLGTFNFPIRAMGTVFDLEVPVANKGMMARGIIPKSRFIAPDALVIDKATGATSRFSRHELFLEELERRLGQEKNPVRSKRQFGRIVRDVRKQVYNLEAMSSLPRAMKPGMEQAYETVRAGQIDILVRQGEKLRSPTPEERAVAMRQHNLFLGTSPGDIAAGRVQTLNLAQNKMTPEFQAWERRVESNFRKWGLTPESMTRIQSVKRLNRYYGAYTTPEMKALTGGAMSMPNFKTLYLDTENPLVQNAFKYAGVEMREGEMLMSKRIANLVEFETTHTKRLSEVVPDLIERINSGTFNPKVGEILGRTESGDLLKFDSSMRILSAEIGAEDIERGFVTLGYSERQKLRSGSKLFGDHKNVLQMMSDKQQKRLLQALKRDGLVQTGFDVIASIDDLRKNSGLLTKQMMTAFGESVVSKGKYGTVDVMDMARALSKSSIANVEGSTAIERFTEGVMQLTAKAHGASLTSGGFADIFAGAARTVEPGRFAALTGKYFGSQVESYLQSLTSPLRGAVGITEAAYSGLGYHDVNLPATIEPRLFDILDSPVISGGSNVAKDFASRVAVGESEKFAIHGELSKTLASLNRQEVAGSAKMARFSIQDAAVRGSVLQDFEQFVAKGGGLVEFGGDVAPMYVPGADVVRPMRKYKSGQKELMGTLESEYSNIVEEASRMYDPSNPLSREEFGRKLQGFQASMSKQWAPGGKGMGGYLRGRMVGSRALLGVSQAGGVTGDAIFRQAGTTQAVGISKEAGLSMFEDMARLGTYDAAALGDMKARFLKGEGITTMLGRHPSIGPFSAQPVMAHMVEGMEDAAQMIIPEVTQNVGIKVGSVTENIAMRFTPLIGLAGDKDADTYTLSMLAPDDEKVLRKSAMYGDSSFARAYTEHQVRSQLLKQKAQASDIGRYSLQDLMEVAGKKLATPETELGQLSLQLTEAKRAVIGSNLDAGSRVRAFGLLEWLEQTPISGKHLNTQQILNNEMSATLSAITEGFKNRQAGMTEEAILNLANTNKAREVLLNGIDLTEEGRAALKATMGVDIGRVEGFNVQRTISDIMESLGVFRSSGASRGANALTGKGGTSAMDLLASLGTRPIGAEMAENAIIGLNKFGANAMSAIKGNLGPVGLGFAGAIALATVLSQPSKSTKATGIEMPPELRASGSGGTGMSPEQVAGNPVQQSQLPPTPGAFGQGRAMVAPNRNYNYTIDLDIGSDIDRSRILSRIGTRFRNVTTNLIDYRGINNPYKDRNEL